MTIFSPSRLVQKITCFCNLLGTGVVGVMFDPTAEGGCARGRADASADVEGR